mgnify:CR=1 FL=1
MYVAENSNFERVELWYNPNIRSWCIFVRKMIEPEAWYGYYVLGGLDLPTTSPIQRELTPELIETYNALVKTHVNYGGF